MVAAIAVVVVLTLGGSAASGRHVAFPTRGSVAARATLRARAAGTEVSFHAEGLPDDGYYWLWLTDADGERVGAGTFRGGRNPVDVTMTAAIRLADARRIWVTDAHRAVVLDTRLGDG